MNYTEEDINNLAEFMYLANSQVYWERGDTYPKVTWRDLIETDRRAWRASAIVALEFKEKRECKCF